MDVWISGWINNTTIYVDCFFLELFLKWVLRHIMTQLFLRSMTRASILLAYLSISNLVLSLNDLVFSISLTFWINDCIFLGATCLTSKPSPVILDIKFNSSKFYDITSAQFVILSIRKARLEIKNCLKNTYQIVLSWFCVPYNHEHLIVYIFVWYWVALRVSWSLCNERII